MARRRTSADSIALLPSGLERPRAPEALHRDEPDGYSGSFAPAPAVARWIHAAFLDAAGPLFNPDHGHLRGARLGVLWTDVEISRHMRAIVATAEVVQVQGGGWRKARQEVQLAEWFGISPLDFLITLHAPTLEVYDDASFCAVIDHELYHCGQARDAFGGPKFSRETGRPVFALRGHDVEQFTGVVRRWGAGPAGVTEMVTAAAGAPAIAQAKIIAACGVCTRAA